MIIETKLKPLAANLKRLNFQWYLHSDNFENSLLENNLDEIWEDTLNQDYTDISYTGERNNVEDAFFTICNFSFQQENKTLFFTFLQISISGFLIATSTEADYNRLIKCLVDLGMEETGISSLKSLIIQKKAAKKPKLITDDKKDLVFIGHGRSSLWRSVEAFLREEQIASEAFETDSRTGEHIVDILNDFLNRATFAIIVVTGEDKMDEGLVRARQNVIHEIGLFQGRLGFNKVAILKQDTADSFSNNDGLQHIPFTGDHIDQSFHKLRVALKKAGLIK